MRRLCGRGAQLQLGVAACRRDGHKLGASTAARMRPSPMRPAAVAGESAESTGMHNAFVIGVDSAPPADVDGVYAGPAADSADISPAEAARRSEAGGRAEALLQKGEAARGGKWGRCGNRPARLQAAAAVFAEAAVAYTLAARFVDAAGCRETEAELQGRAEMPGHRTTALEKAASAYAAAAATSSSGQASWAADKAVTVLAGLRGQAEADGDITAAAGFCEQAATLHALQADRQSGGGGITAGDAGASCLARSSQLEAAAESWEAAAELYHLLAGSVGAASAVSLRKATDALQMAATTLGTAGVESIRLAASQHSSAAGTAGAGGSAGIAGKDAAGRAAAQFGRCERLLADVVAKSLDALAGDSVINRHYRRANTRVVLKQAVVAVGAEVAAAACGQTSGRALDLVQKLQRLEAEAVGLSGGSGLSRLEKNPWTIVLECGAAVGELDEEELGAAYIRLGLSRGDDPCQWSWEREVLSSSVMGLRMAADLDDAGLDIC